jgi:hypothetical protein
MSFFTVSFHMTFYRVAFKYKPYRETKPPMHPVVKTHNTVPLMALKDRKSFIKAIRTARRVASGKRAAAACSACKKSRARCDDTRPCVRCRSLGICDGCSVPERANTENTKVLPDVVNVRSSDSSSSVYIKSSDSFASDQQDSDGHFKPSNEIELFDIYSGPNFVPGKNDDAHAHPVSEATSSNKIRVNASSFVRFEPMQLPCFTKDQRHSTPPSALSSSILAENIATAYAMLHSLNSLAFSMNLQQQSMHFQQRLQPVLPQIMPSQFLMPSSSNLRQSPYACFGTCPAFPQTPPPSSLPACFGAPPRH